MFKLNFDLDLDAEAIAGVFESAIKRATSNSAQPLQNFLLSQADSKLKDSKELWRSGLSIESLDEGSYMIVFSGKLANMIEDGFTGDELKRILLSGARAAHNAAQSESKKKWVDVPFGIGEHAARKMTVSLSGLSSAHEVASKFTRTTKSGQVGPGHALSKRVGDVIRSRSSGDAHAKVGFMTIRRVSENSQLKGWKGAKIMSNEFGIDKLLNDILQLELDKIGEF